MKKAIILLFFLSLLFFSHSNSVFSFSLKKSLSSVGEKFSQLSAPKKILGGYLAITVPHGLYKSFILDRVWQNNEFRSAQLNHKVILFFGDIIFFPFVNKPNKWDSVRENTKNNETYCNPVFGILCTIVKKLFFGKIRKKCKFPFVHVNKDKCLFCPVQKEIENKKCSFSLHSFGNGVLTTDVLFAKNKIQDNYRKIFLKK